MIAASQPVYSATRFPRAFSWLQINSTPSGDIPRNCPFANSFSPLHLRAHLARRIRSYKITGRWHPLSINPTLCPLCLSGKPALSALCLHFPSPDLDRSFSVLSVPLWQIQSSIPSPGASDLHNFRAAVTSFRINTCISVASKRLYLSLESTLTKKPGEGGPPTPNGVSAARGRRRWLRLGGRRLGRRRLLSGSRSRAGLSRCCC